MTSYISQAYQDAQNWAVGAFQETSSKVGAAYSVLHQDVTALFQGRSIEVFKSLSEDRKSDVALKVALVALTSLFLPTIPVIILATLTFTRLTSENKPGFDGLADAIKNAHAQHNPSAFAFFKR